MLKIEIRFMRTAAWTARNSDKKPAWRAGTGTDNRPTFPKSKSLSGSESESRPDSDSDFDMADKGTDNLRYTGADAAGNPGLREKKVYALKGRHKRDSTACCAPSGRRSGA